MTDRVGGGTLVSMMNTGQRYSLHREFLLVLAEAALNLSREFAERASERLGASWHSCYTAAERRRQRRALARLDDRLLRDIGLTRAQAQAEARKPFWRC